jgi:uncharacterized protein YaaW (UPF0174 family)
LSQSLRIDLPGSTAENVTKALLNILLTEGHVPKIIQCDNGKHFAASVLTELMKVEIKHTLILTILEQTGSAGQER